MIFLFMFIFLAIVRMFFWLLLFTKFRFGPSTRNEEIRFPGVSIIVVVKNEYDGLQKLVPLLLSQKYPDFEIIILNDFSTDNTAQYLNSIDDDRLTVVDCYKDLPGKKYALSQAISIAKNDVMLFTDGDCYPASVEWISRMVGVMSKNTAIVLGFGMMIKKNHPAAFLSRYDTIFTAILYGSAAKIGFPYMGVGRNLSYLKSLYLQVGGNEKHADLSSGDDDLQIQLMANVTNTSTCLDPLAFTFSEPKKTLKEWFRQKARHVSVAIAYQKKSKIYLVLFALLHLGFIYSGLISLYFYPLPSFIIFGFFYMATFPINLKNYDILGEKILAYFFPLADITFAFLNPLILILAQISTSGKWK